MTVTLSELPDILTVSELAAFLRIGRRQAYSLAEQIGGRRIGKSIRIPRAAVLAFLRIDQEPRP